MEGEAGTVADSRERSVGDGGPWRQRRGVAGDARVAPQDAAREVPLRCTGDAGGTGGGAGVDSRKTSLKKHVGLPYYDIPRHFFYSR